MTAHLVERMVQHQTSVFAEMSALAARTGAINLGQGFPDVDGPPEVREAAVEAIRTGRGNQYPPGTGVPELRDAIAVHQQRFYGLEVDPDREVFVTTGATEAIATAVLALLEPGDELLMFAPWFDMYDAVTSLAGAVRRSVPLRAPYFRPDLDELRAAVTPRTRVLLLNSPHNPTGTVFSPAELAGIADIAAEHDLVVISDEVYEHLVLDGVPHVPFAGLPGMRDRTLTVSSAGKSLSLTGWKVGWVTGPARLVSAVRTVRQHMSYVSGGPFQYAVAVGLGLPDEYWRGLADGLQAQRDLFCEGLVGIGYGVAVPAATYFVTADVAPLGVDDGTDFCRRLPERAGVVAIPLADFYEGDEGTTLVRFAFCKKPAVLYEALDRLAAASRRP